MLLYIAHAVCTCSLHCPVVHVPGQSQLREGLYSDGMMNKQTQVFNFQCFSLCYSINYPFLELLRATKPPGDFFCIGVNFGPGIFWGFAGSPRDYFGS